MIVEAVGAAVAKYGAIVGGLLIGTAAKYGLALTDGKRLTLKGAAADLLLLGMLGLLAILVSDSLALTGNARALAGALAAVSSDRLIRLARDQFMKSAEGQISNLMPGVEKEAILHVPAGDGAPDHIDVEAPAITPEGRMRVNLSRAYGGKKTLPLDVRELLRKLD